MGVYARSPLKMRPSAGVAAFVALAIVLSACSSRDHDDRSPSPVASASGASGADANLAHALEIDPDSAFGLPKPLGLEPILQDETLVLDSKDSPVDGAAVLNGDACDPVDPDRVPCTYELTFSSLPPGVEKGSVLVSDVAPALPHGLLVKVTSIDASAKVATVRATEATLGDALEQGEFLVERQFTPADVVEVTLAPGVTSAGGPGLGLASAAGFGSSRPGTNVAQGLADAAGGSVRTGDGAGLGFQYDIANVALGEGAVANGHVGFDVGCGAYGGLTWKKYLGVPVYPNGVYFQAKCGASQDGSLTVTADHKATIDQRATIVALHLDAITFWVGPVPIVLIPTITVTASASGEVEANMTFGASEHFGAQAGINYSKGFHLIKDFSFDFDSTTTNVSSRLTARAGVEVGEALMLYGLVGPQLTQEIYARLEANAPGTSPIWCLKGGITAGVALNVDLGFDVLRYGPETLYEKEIDLECAANQPPSVSIKNGDHGLVVYPASSYQRPEIFATSADAEQGALAITWAADGKQLGSSASGSAFSLASLSLGVHTVTATVTDGDGASATATAVVTAKDATATAQILIKDGSGQWVDGDSASGTTGGQLLVKVVSRTPLGVQAGECLPTAWAGGLAVDPQSGCEFRVNLTKAGTFPLTATVTDPDGKKVADAITVTVANPAPGSPPALTAIGAVNTSVTPNAALCNGCAMAPGSLVKLTTLYTNASAAGKSVKYAWEYQRAQTGYISAWTALPGTDTAPSTGSVRSFTAPTEFNRYYMFTFRVTVSDASTGAQYFQNTFALTYQGPPA